MPFFSSFTTQSCCGSNVSRRIVGSRIKPLSLLLSIAMIVYAILSTTDKQWTSSNTSNSFFWRKRMSINLRTGGSEKNCIAAPFLDRLLEYVVEFLYFYSRYRIEVYSGDYQPHCAHPSRE